MAKYISFSDILQCSNRIPCAPTSTSDKDASLPAMRNRSACPRIPLVAHSRPWRSGLCIASALTIWAWWSSSWLLAYSLHVLFVFMAIIKPDFLLRLSKVHNQSSPSPWQRTILSLALKWTGNVITWLLGNYANVTNRPTVGAEFNCISDCMQAQNGAPDRNEGERFCVVTRHMQHA